MKLLLIFRINFQYNNQEKSKYNYNQKNDSKFFIDDTESQNIYYNDINLS